MIRVLLTTLLFAGSAAGTPLHFDSLYFFGDSLTDTGNVYTATSVLRSYTFGLIPRHPTAPYANGRFSDGPVWAEHVAAQLGHPGDAAPGGLSLGWFGKVSGPGNNFAVGGARTGYGGALGLLDYAVPTGMFQQVDYYLEKTRTGADPNGLYFLLGGGNDLRDAARVGDAGARYATAAWAAYNLAVSIYDLYVAGARQFYVINAPNVGVIPESVSDGVMETGLEASVNFNAVLTSYRDLLATLPGMNMHLFDLFSFHNEIVADTLSGGPIYGFTSMSPCKDNPTSCSESLYFDSIHPTARAHALVGERIAADVRGLSSSWASFDSMELVHNPEPSTTVMMMAAAGLAIGLRRRASRGRP